jgi:hypothetical protein
VSDQEETCRGCGLKLGNNSWLRQPNCSRCGEVVCSFCGPYNSGDGFEVAGERYDSLCHDCYWELVDSYARKQESEFEDD